MRINLNTFSLLLKSSWCIITIIFAVFSPKQRKKKPLILRQVPLFVVTYTMQFSAILLQQLSSLSVIHICIYLLYPSLFHQSSSIPTFPFANAFYSMITPQSIALIFWIFISIIWYGCLSVTPLTCRLQIFTLLIFFLTLKSCSLILLTNFASTILSP